MRLSKLKTGLVLGIFISFMHLVWLVLIATGIAQTYLDFVLKLHMLANPYQVLPLDYLNGLLLLVITFVVGFVVGWIFALFHNMLHRK